MPDGSRSSTRQGLFGPASWLAGTPAALALLDQALVSASNAATGVVLARSVEASQFGGFVLANAALWLLVTVQQGLVLRPMTLDGAMLDEAAFGRLLRAAALLAAAVATAGAVALGVLALSWDVLRPYAPALVVATAAMQAQELVRRALYARGRAGAALANDTLSYGAQALLFVALAIGGDLTVSRAIWLMGGTSLLAAGLGVGQLRSLLAGPVDGVRSVAARSLRLGRWIAPSMVLSTLALAAQPVLLERFHGLAAAAAFGVVAQMIGPIHLLTRPVESHYVPRAVHALAQGGEAALGRVRRAAAFVSVAPSATYLVALAVAPEPLLGLVYGPAYTAEASIVRAFALVQLLALPLLLLNLEVNVRRLQRPALAADLWSVALLLGPGVLLVWQLGLAGAALGALLALTGKVAILAVVTHRASRARETARCARYAGSLPASP